MLSAGVAPRRHQCNVLLLTGHAEHGVLDTALFDGLIRVDLLVAPVTESGAVGRETYLPTGAHWRCARTGTTYEGGTWRTLDAPPTVFHFCCGTMRIFRWPADAAGPGEEARAARRDEAVASARSFLRIPPGTGEQAFHTVEALAQDLRGPFADVVRRVLGPWAQHTVSRRRTAGGLSVPMRLADARAGRRRRGSTPVGGSATVRS
ncbi:hypothetical protein [Streptomyces atratus]|uniref:hypothetical protein n=1 Tax=Streptomyces atratus TaxID=1893 RepID=UPI00378855BC